MTRIRALSILIIFAAVLVIYFGNLSYNNYQAQASHYIKGNLWNEETCSSCHPGAQADVLKSYHVKQEARYGSIDSWDPLLLDLIDKAYVTGLADKWGFDESSNSTLIFNYTGDIIGFTTSDCRVCHLKGEFDWKEALNVTPDADHDDSFLDVPSDAVCADRCHQRDTAVRAVMWGSDNYAKYDAHANASTGCNQCHLTTNHQIGRNMTIDSRLTEIYPMEKCIDCHFEVTHGMYADAHLVNVSCEACHIPMLPGGGPVEGMIIDSVDWSNGYRETAFHSEDFRPVLAWFNGSVEGLPSPSDRNDTGVILKPFNVIKVSWWDKGTDIVSNNSTQWGRPIMLSIVRQADKDNDKEVSLSEMRSFDMDDDGVPDYPGAIKRELDVYYSISHNIVSNETDNIMGAGALWCDDCHGTNQTRIDWTALGYETDPAETDPPTNFSTYNLTVEIVPLRPKPVEIENEPKLFKDLFGSGDQ